MNLQSRSKRWLAAVDVAKAMTGALVQSFKMFRAAGRQLDAQAQKTMIDGLFQLQLTIEADPVVEGEPLHDVLGDVVAALDALRVGPGFLDAMEALDAALEAASKSLREWTADENSKIEEIVGELERAFLLSLIITLTSHHFVSDWDEKWQQHHQRFLAGHVKADLPHYVHMNGLIPSEKLGPGRVHVEHLHSALTSGTSLFIAGAPRRDVEKYPEFQSIIYSQWFAYMHSIWDEQYRHRIAGFFDTPAERIRQRDVINDFFGDIRLIRNDYVHKKGIANEAVNVRLLKWGFEAGQPLDITTQQMVSLIELFPRDALMVKPTPQPIVKKDRKTAPGTLPPDVLEDIMKRTSELGLSKDDVLEEAFSLWLASKST